MGDSDYISWPDGNSGLAMACVDEESISFRFVHACSCVCLASSGDSVSRLDQQRASYERCPPQCVIDGRFRFTPGGERRRPQE